MLSGRHELYVTSLGVLLADLGARVQVMDRGRPLPRRPGDGLQVIVLESPLPSELRHAATLGLPVVVLTEAAGAERAHAAAALGAAALVDKTASVAELAQGIRRALRTTPKATADFLTPRQHEVLELIVEGLDNRQIAARLGISERTARAHTSSVMHRLGTTNRTRAAVAALRRGLLTCLALVALVSILGVATAHAAPATPAELSRAISAQMRLLGNGSGAWAWDTDGGRLLYARRAERARVPASVEKLLTTATALDRMGPEWRFETAVLAQGEPLNGNLAGNLYLKGQGDPSLGEPQLARLAQGIGEAGIETVDGRVYGDESRFDARRGGPASGYRVSRWVGPLSALAFAHGAARPFGSGFQSQPALFTARRLAAELKRTGVFVAQAARAGKAPAGGRPLASVQSPDLAALVRHTNLVSDNYYAETLIKSLGAQFAGVGSTAAGASVVRRFAREMDVRARVVDGSGLSRANSIAPAAVGRLLLRARERPWFDSFYRALPLAGRTGTLAHRMRRTSANGRCRAKTGTLIAVSGLAGYCRTARGKTIAFALLMNGVNVTAARTVQDRISAALAAYKG